MTTEIDHMIAEIQATGLQPPDDSMSEITSAVNTSPFSWEVNIGLPYILKYNSLSDKRRHTLKHRVDLFYASTKDMVETVNYSMQLIDEVIENRRKNAVPTNHPAPESVSNVTSEPVPDSVVSTHSEPIPDTVPSTVPIPDQIPSNEPDLHCESIPEEVPDASTSSNAPVAPSPDAEEPSLARLLSKSMERMQQQSEALAKSCLESHKQIFGQFHEIIQDNKKIKTVGSDIQSRLIVQQKSTDFPKIPTPITEDSIDAWTQQIYDTLKRYPWNLDDKSIADFDIPQGPISD